MNKWSSCIPLKRTNYWWLLAFNIFCACANRKSHLDGTSTPTHSQQGNYPSSPCATNTLVTTAFCVICQRVVLCYSTQFDEAKLSCVYQQEARAGQMNLYTAKQEELGTVYTNEMLINISGSQSSHRQCLTVKEEGRGCLKQQRNPLHPLLPVCRIPMKKSNTQAPSQSILSFSHISTDPSTNNRACQVGEIISKEKKCSI